MTETPAVYEYESSGTKWAKLRIVDARREWESLYRLILDEGWSVTRWSGQTVTTNEQTILITFTRKEPTDS